MRVYVSKDLLEKSDLTGKYVYPLLFNTYFSLKDNFCVCDQTINIYCHLGYVFNLFYFPFLFYLFIYFSNGSFQTEIASKRMKEVIYICTSHWFSFSYQMCISEVKDS